MQFDGRFDRLQEFVRQLLVVIERDVDRHRHTEAAD